LLASRSTAVAIATCAVLTALAGVAGAAEMLTIPVATKKAESVAARTCDRDRHCVRHGVLNCRRQAARVVLCRIFDERKTRVQGRYECTRLIRFAVDPETGRAPLTGLGRWHC
jgi:hypothetical protein